VKPEPVMVQGMIRGKEFVFMCPWCGLEHRHTFKTQRRTFPKVGDRLGFRFSACKNRDAPTAYVLQVGGP